MNVQIQMTPSILDHKKNDIRKNTSICRRENIFSAQHVKSIFETKFQKFWFKNKPYKKGTKFCLWTKRLYYFKSIIWLILLNFFYCGALAQIHEIRLKYFSKWQNEKFNRTIWLRYILSFANVQWFSRPKSVGEKVCIL